MVPHALLALYVAALLAGGAATLAFAEGFHRSRSAVSLWMSLILACLTLQVGLNGVVLYVYVNIRPQGLEAISLLSAACCGALLPGLWLLFRSLFGARADRWLRLWVAWALIHWVALALSMVRGSPSWSGLLLQGLYGIVLLEGLILGVLALGRRGQLEETRRQGLYLFLGVLATSLIPLGVQTLTPMRDARWMAGLMGFLRHGGTPLFLLLWSASCLALLIRKKTRGEVDLEGLVPLAPNLDALGLTERESEVASRLLRRHSYREIAQALFISVSTVQTHAHRIYRKAAVGGRREFIAKVSH